MMLLSEANVARRWASCGEAARRRRGGEGVAEADFDGDEEVVGEEAIRLSTLRSEWAGKGRRHTFI